MAYAYNNCRFCKEHETDSDRLVKYGVRHYAHFKCYLDAGKKVDDLSRWQLEKFPYRLLKERGLVERVSALLNYGKTFVDPR